MHGSMAAPSSALHRPAAPHSTHSAQRRHAGAGASGRRAAVACGVARRPGGVARSSADQATAEVAVQVTEEAINVAATGAPAGAGAAGAGARAASLDLEDFVWKKAQTRVTVYSAQQYVTNYLSGPLRDGGFENLHFVEARLDSDTAELAKNSPVVCLFVNDNCNAKTVKKLARGGTKMIAMRCAGFDRVDLEACAEHGIKVARVPTYSPTSVAEHAVALLMALNRRLTQAYTRVQAGNYSLSPLVGFELKGKTVGVIGTGAIGVEACRIFKGMGMNVMAYDLRPNPLVEAMGIAYVSIEEMLPLSDVVSLHVPLLPSTFEIMNRPRISLMKQGAILLNVSRGGLVDSEELMAALERGQIGGIGMDVWENEGDLFFTDWTDMDISTRMKFWDRKFKMLTSYPQVLITPHSAFLTHEALANIANTTMQNITEFVEGKPLTNELKAKPSKA